MTIYRDDEFGEIDVRKLRRARYIRVSVAPNGKLRASMPLFASSRGLRSLLSESREEIRAMLAIHTNGQVYKDGMRVGKSHAIIASYAPIFSVSTKKLRIIVELPETQDIESPIVQVSIREEVRKALRKEAKHYLPRRLATLAAQLDCSYERVRFSHAGTRWGSCSTAGTISLNIALMQLPFELIDYVLIHELCHTKQMNHSQNFWQLVEQADPDYLTHRKLLKTHTPTI